jgi:hypothetical protein
MSRRFYALGLGQQKQAVVESSSPTLATSGVEISLDMTALPDTAEFRRLAEEIRLFVLEQPWPVGAGG